MATEVGYPDGKTQCVCGAEFYMLWNGGELDAYACKCGRYYHGQHIGAVMRVLEPGERRPWDGDDD